MTRTEIIELANQLTERKGEKVLNMQSLYRFVVQDICKRQRFWWRRVYTSFALVVGTKTYDLSSVTTSPSLSEILFDEITKFTVLLSSSPYEVSELAPVFDQQALLDMVIGTAQVSPTRYTMEAGDYKTVRIDPPDAAYTAYIVGWAMPNPASDTSNDTVPLIPAWGHNVIVDGLRFKVFSFVYGDGNAKTVSAKKDYEQGIEDLEMRRQFDPNQRRQLALTESAVRST